jgi:type IV secretion system protein VirB9
VQVVELPSPAAPGQLKPVGTDGKPAEAADPPPRQPGQRRRACAAGPQRLHQLDAGLSLRRWRALSGLCLAGQITDIALQPGEQLVGAGPVAAGDTVRWIIGDTERARRDQAGPYPRQADAPELMTNLVINTDRRTYHMELRSTPRPIWRRSPGNIRRTSSSRCAARTPGRGCAAGRDRHRPRAVNFRYDVTGDRAPWRPLRAFDDGRQVFIEFPRGIGQGEMPPLFVVGPEGDTSELVNYRVRGNYMIVDRLFAAAELRFGAGESEAPHRPHRREAGIVSDERSREEKGPEPGEDDARPLTGEPVAPMRLRPSRRASPACRARCWPVSAWSPASGRRRADLCAQTNAAQQGRGTLFHRQPLDAGWPGGLPKDYTGPKLGPPLPGDLGRPILNAQNAGPPFDRDAPGPSPEEQRRRRSWRRPAPRACSRRPRRGPAQPAATAAIPTAPAPDLASLGLAPQPATPSAQDRQLAFLNQTPDKRTVSPDRVAAPARPMSFRPAR